MLKALLATKAKKFFKERAEKSKRCTFTERMKASLLCPRKLAGILTSRCQAPSSLIDFGSGWVFGHNSKAFISC